MCNIYIYVIIKRDGDKLEAKWDQTVGVELYDHAGDNGMAPMAFDDYENVNLVRKCFV